MEHVSFSPCRTVIYSQWLPVQTMELTEPVTFTGTPDDLELLDACIENPDGDAPPSEHEVVGQYASQLVDCKTNTST